MASVVLIQSCGRVDLLPDQTNAVKMEDSNKTETEIGKETETEKGIEMQIIGSQEIIVSIGWRVITMEIVVEKDGTAVKETLHPLIIIIREGTLTTRPTRPPRRILLRPLDVDLTGSLP